MSSVFTSSRRTRPWSCVSMKSRASRRWTGRRPCCRCVRDRWRGAHTTIRATAPPTSLQPWRLPPAGSLPAVRGVTARWISEGSLMLSTPRCRPGWMSTSILDNSAIHKTALIRRWLAQRPRYHVHFTPTSSSWLNLVERWFGLLTEKQLRRGVYRSTRELEEAIARYVESTNAHAKPFVWTKSAEDILASLSRFCRRTYNSVH